MAKRMKPSGKYNQDNDFWVGQGITRSWKARTK